MRFTKGHVIGFSLLILGVCAFLPIKIELDSKPRTGIFINPGPDHPWWIPLSYEIYEIPSYLIQYVIFGIILLTLGLAILINVSFFTYNPKDRM